MPALAPALFRPGAGARTAPDNPARIAFVTRHPCPETSSYGVCLDVVDHVIPVCAQPAFPTTVLDTPANMAWEPADEAEVKDGFERRLCRAWNARRGYSLDRRRIAMPS